MSTSTTIQGTVTLTPIGAVDTSSASSGVSMFTLNFQQDIISTGSIIQFEYWVNNVGEPLPGLLNGFIPLEDAVTTQGISNQCTIAIPSTNNVYNPLLPQEVKVRVYVGRTSALQSPEIMVSEWSNTCPLHNAPPQPETPVAYLVRGESPPTYYYGDYLYVKIPDNLAYVENEIDFIISYSYKDLTGAFRWVVSPPRSWTRYPLFDTILIDEIELPNDVEHSSVVYVAVNAVFNYEFQGSNYYSVSEISTTVQAIEDGYDAPILEPINIPDDYLIYDTSNPTQDIVLNWLPPSSSIIPVFAITSYTVELLVNGTVVDSVPNIPNNQLTLTYSIPNIYANALNVTELEFIVKGFFNNGESEQSNSQTVNTFRYALAPQTLIVHSASSGSSPGLIDLALTFLNPLNKGLGNVVNFVVNLNDDNGDIKATQNVSYVQGVAPYSVYFNEVESTNEGSVEVYMVNQDTNPQSVGGNFVNLNGASTSENYTVSDLPIMLSHTNNGLVITSQWQSTNLLTPVGVMNYINTLTLPPQIQSIPFSTQPGEYESYSVVLNSSNTGEFLYDFVFQSSFFPNISFFDSPLQNVSNQAGIGVGFLNQQPNGGNGDVFP